MKSELTGADRMLIEIAELTAVVIEEKKNGNKPTLRSAAGMGDVYYARHQWAEEVRTQPKQIELGYEDKAEVPASAGGPPTASSD